MATIETLHPQADRNDPSRMIGWASDGGLVNLPEGARGLSVRVELISTARRLGNGKPVYNSRPAPDEVMGEQWKVARSHGVVDRIWTIIDEAALVRQVRTWLGVVNEIEVERKQFPPMDGDPVVTQVKCLYKGMVTLIEHTFVPQMVVTLVRSDGSLQWRPNQDPKTQVPLGRTTERELSREPLGQIVAWRVHLPAGNRPPVEIKPDTRVDIFAENPAAGRVERIQAIWDGLSPEQKQERLARYPVCPSCGKFRFDATLGLNACGKCIGLTGYEAAILPVLRGIDPTVTTAPDSTGKSLQFRFVDEKVSHRFRKGYGFDWDNDAQCLRAGERNCLKVWNRMRPVPVEVVCDLVPLFGAFGLTLEVNPSEPREVLIHGDWVATASGKKILGVKGSKAKGYTLHGVEQLEVAAGRLMDALSGAQISYDLRIGENEAVPTPPDGWQHLWWVK